MFSSIKEAWGEDFNLRTKKSLIDQNIITTETNQSINLIPPDINYENQIYCKHCAQLINEPFKTNKKIIESFDTFAKSDISKNIKDLDPVYKQAILVGLLFIILLSIFDKKL